MLVGREHHLRELHSAWESTQRGASRLAVVWGRRRVGKTFLLSQFTADLPCVYFTATRNDSEAEQVSRLHEAATRALGDKIHLAGGSFNSIETALRFFQHLSVDAPLVVVLDEAPRLAAARQDLGDLISAIIESPPAGAKLLLILCGSAVAAMRHLIGPDGGLYRRADPELRLDPLDPWESAQLLPNLEAAQIVEAYAACGGYPLHLQQWDPQLSSNDNLAQLAGSPAGLLVRDAVDIMFEDLDARAGYERVLATMARGPVRRSKIASRAQQRIDYTLGHLQRSGYVIAERPIGSSPTADPLYRLVDTYLRFWFSVLRQDAELIDGGQGAAVLRRAEPRWNAHVEATWEEIARGHAVRLVAEGEFPRDLIIGRWWKDEAVELDVVGLDTAGNAALIGEVKWQDRPMDTGQVNLLHRQSAALVGASDSPTSVLWSRHGVTDDVARTPGIRWFTPQTVFGRR